MIPIGAAIEGLVKAIELAKKSQEFFVQFESHRRRIFKTEVEPTFRSLRLVIQSYGDDIAAFQADIRNSQSCADGAKAIAEFVERRRKTVRERDELISTLNAASSYWFEKSQFTSNKPYDAYRTFADTISDYFRFYSNLGRRSSAQTSILQIAESLIENCKLKSEPEQSEAWPDVQKRILGVCTKVLQILEQKYAAIFQSYATLRLICVGTNSDALQKS